MNSKEPTENEVPLGRMLQEWRVNAALPPRFQEQIWRRIADSERSPKAPWFQDLWQTIEAAFRRPALAASYLAILLVVGVGVGIVQARQDTVRIESALGSRYLQAVDPYQASR